MKILVITQYFWPEDFRINELVSELKNRGHDIHVLTGRPNYPEGKTYPLYRKDKKNFMFFSGIPVKRSPIPARGNNSVRLIINYLSFIIFGTVNAISLSRKHKFDLTFVFEPSPITVCLPAIFLKKVSKIPIIFWVLDLWPETLQAVGVIKKKSIVNRIIKRLVKYIYKNCDVILGQSPEFVTKIKRDTPANVSVEYFPNWVESDFTNNHLPEDKFFLDKNSVFKIIFAGNIGEAQDFGTILSGIAMIGHEVPVQLHVYGDGRKKDWVGKKVIEMNLSNRVFLHGRVPQSEISKILYSADSLLVSLRKDPILDITIPGKLQTYLSIGKPILGIASGECSRVILESNSGLVSPPGDKNSFHKNIINLYKANQNLRNEMGKNGSQYANLYFNKDKIIDNLEHIINRF